MSSMSRSALIPPAAALLAALILLPTPVEAQEGPVEVYRAYWDSGLTPSDPGAERFRSRAMLEEFRAFLEEEPEMAREALEFMTALYRELQEAAELGTVEVVEQTPELTVLEIEFQGRSGPLDGGLPQRATVEMVLEAEGWKVDREAFTSSMGGGGQEDAHGDACPAGTILGDDSGPHTLLFRGEEGEVRLHFGEALLLQEGNDLTLRLPAMASSQLDLRVPGGATAAGDHSASLWGMRASGGCPGLPEALVYDDGEGLFTWQPGSGPGTVDVEFDISGSGGGPTLVSGSLQGVPLVDVSPSPLLAGSYLLAFDDEVTPHRGAVLHHVAEERLEISLEFVRGSGGGASSFSVPGFTGEPGVFVGDVRFGHLQVAVVEEFGTGGVRLELREIPEEQVPAGGADIQQALESSVLRARVVTDRAVVIPSLAPVGG
jgi:hypothetical protein